MLVLSAVTIMGGCQLVPDLVDYRIQEEPAYFEQRYPSSMIVVGTIISDRRVGPPVRSHWNKDIEYTLSRMRFRVENVLRGDMSRGDHDVYYFSFLSSIDGIKPLGIWHAPGYLFYMNRDKGVIRLACDGWGTCEIPIWSGAHPHYRAFPGESLDEILADLLLTKGTGVSDEQFAMGISKVPGNTPANYVIPKLELLARSESPVVRTEACEYLGAYGKPCHSPR